MGTWSDFCSQGEAMAVAFGGERLDDVTWVFQLPGAAEGRKQNVLVVLETVTKDFQVIRVWSPVIPAA